MVLASPGAVAPVTEKILATISSHDFRALGVTSVAMVGLVEGIRVRRSKLKSRGIISRNKLLAFLSDQTTSVSFSARLLLTTVGCLP